ncbi:MAG: hypothetical protein R3223_00695 [Longimicrobiales bacterium]|nr:hypothetical protein [Longimicrobiales bacterium]
MLCIPLLAGCDGGTPADVTGPAPSTPGLDETTSIDEAPPRIDFEDVHFEGTGSAGYFRVDVELDAAAILTPPETASSEIQLLRDLRILTFFEEDGGKGESIVGDGAIHNAATGLFAIGGLEEVPVSGTLTYVENGTEVVETVEGVLTVDLEAQVEEPVKGDFFRECGDACLQFDISGSIEQAEGPAPCLITGTFTIGTPEQPS